MQESKDGRFVRLETFESERARLTAQLDRLKRELRQLQERQALPLEEMFSGTPVASAVELAESFAAEAVEACLNERPVADDAIEALYQGLASLSGQALANTKALKTAREGWAHEKSDCHSLLEHLGLVAQDCRTESGWLHLIRVRATLSPLGLHVPGYFD